MIDVNDVTILPSNERTFPQTLNSIVRHVIYNLKGYTCLLLLYFKLANKTQWLKTCVFNHFNSSFDTPNILYKVSF